MTSTVIGVDVGGVRKGFHAVALRAGMFVDKVTSSDPAGIAAWCVDHEACVVGVDAPCCWSVGGSSRLAERELNQRGLHCFSTPTRKHARANRTGFYGWVFNGERLYECLESRRYLRFNGVRTEDLTCIETFPHAVACAMAGSVIPAKPKAKVRREVLRSEGYDVSDLSCVDFVDAALCAVAAESFRRNQYHSYGDRAEGFIVALPASRP